MPLYEFYCQPCHTLFTFRSARVDTVTVPPCPRCGAALKREVSAFSHLVRGKGRDDEGGAEQAGGEAGADDRMERVLSRLGERLEGLSDDDADPREAVRTMRQLASEEGLSFNREVREAMARIEAGEDPEKIDEEYSEVLDTDNPFAGDGEASGAPRAGGRSLRRLCGPRRDPVWYDLKRE